MAGALIDYSDFRTLHIRANPDKSAILEPTFHLNAGESLKVVLSGAEGVDPSTLVLSLHGKEAPFPALVTPPSVWYPTPGNPGSYYASVDLSTSAVTSLLSGVIPGGEVLIRLYVADGSNVYVDCDVPLSPAPYRSAGTWPAPTSPFATENQVVLRSALHGALQEILAMPTLSAANREARLQSLIAALYAATTP